MNTTSISHHLFVAALTSPSSVVAIQSGRSVDDTATQNESSSSASLPKAFGAKGASKPSPNQLTVEQLAAMAARYWPDFPFDRGWKEEAVA